MRLLLSILILLSIAAAQGNITEYMNVTVSTSCPGDVLVMNASTSDGQPVPDVELRLILYVPYYGLRALEHTGQDGTASVSLTRAGIYRVYMYTQDYFHDDYVEFNYSTLCPPPPPRNMTLTLSPDCQNRILKVSAEDNNTPIDGVFIRSLNWSSLTGPDGYAILPLYEGEVFIDAEKDGYAPDEFYSNISCAPPPECVSDLDCPDVKSCEGGTCINVTGVCGFPENHTWMRYACCNDSDCGNGSSCINNICVPKPVPYEPKNVSTPSVPNTTNISGKAGEPQASAICPASSIILLAFLMLTKNQSGLPG